jgi:hypothetical protein
MELYRIMDDGSKGHRELKVGEAIAAISILSVN